MLRELDYPTIGQRLREARETEGLSLRKLARRSGVSKSALSAIENNATTPTVESVERVAIALNTPITSLWAGDPGIDATEVRMLGPRDEIAALGGGARPRRVLQGEGMLRITRSFWHDGELFEASSGSVTRCVAPDHPAVKAHPFHVEPCYSKDRTSGVLHFLEMRRAGRLGTTRANHGPRRDWLLPTRAPRDETWRLN